MGLRFFLLKIKNRYFIKNQGLSRVIGFKEISMNNFIYLSKVSSQILQDGNVDLLSRFVSSLFFNKRVFAGDSVTNEERIFSIECLALYSARYPWAYERELLLLESGAKDGVKFVVPVDKLIYSYAYGYISSRSEPMGAQVAASLAKRMPLFFTLLRGSVETLNFIFEQGGSKLRCKQEIL